MSHRHPIAALCLLGVALLTPLACAQNAAPPKASAPIPDTRPPTLSRQDAEARLATLEQAIEVERARLIVLITDRSESDPALRESAELLEIAERLPALEEDLRLLKLELKPAEREASKP